MEKIGIINCYKMSKSCSGRLCFPAMNSRSDAFQAYGPEGFELRAFGHCNECCKTSPEDIALRASSMREAGVETIHISTCIKKFCPNYDNFIQILSKDFKIVTGTHALV